MAERTGNLEVVAAAPEHAEAIRALDGLSASTRRLLHHDLSRDDRCCLIAVSDGDVVGYAAALLQLEEAHVIDVAVSPAHRRQGLGTRLLRSLLARVAERGAGGVTLEVRRGNEAALALYRRLGFRVEGERPRYYPGGEDALLMWKRDVPC